jgi:hypothetical protein
MITDIEFQIFITSRYYEESSNNTGFNIRRGHLGVKRLLSRLVSKAMLTFIQLVLMVVC